MSNPARYGPMSARIYRLLLDPLVYPLRKRLSYFCTRLPAHSVLDVACATGAQCRMLSRAGIRAVGIDISQAMIETAAQHGGKLTSFIVGSALALPFEDDTFDAVILSLALHEHPELERQAMVEQALRVVRPQGLLLLADYTRPRRPFLNPAWLFVRLIENLAGKEHRRGFRDFIHLGGLEDFAKRAGIRRFLLHGSHFGAIGILWTRKSSSTRTSAA
jgi:ubiquinone/menaquinone biosynthesis C-methylase UbiE